MNTKIKTKLMVVFGWCLLISIAIQNWIQHHNWAASAGIVLLGWIAMSIMTSSWEAYEKWKDDKESENRRHKHDDRLFGEWELLKKGNPELFDKLS